MIAHISIGVRDIATSKRFYDAALKPLGYKYQGPRDRWSVMGMGATASRFGLSRPSARFQPTKSPVSTSALRHRMPPP
jgi:catechol 2,3-dioxygenase-like lactoylglutathione lyase family enzyme